MTTPRWLRRTAIAALVVLAFSAVGLQVASAEVTFTEFTAGISGITLGIDVGADSNLWFTEVLAGVVGRITPAGVVTEFDEGVPADFGPGRIAAGPDGNLWFVERDSDRIGSVSTAGVITVYDGPGSNPQDIAAGPDGNVWFTEGAPDAIGRVNLPEQPPTTPTTGGTGSTTTTARAGTGAAVAPRFTG